MMNANAAQNTLMIGSACFSNGSMMPEVPSKAIMPWPIARRTPPKNTALRCPSQRSAMIPPSTGVI